MPLDFDAGVKYISKVDPTMRKIVREVGDNRLQPGSRGDHFTTLLRAIIGQQLSAKAAETIWQRLIALDANGKRLKPEDVLAMRDADMRGVGMSNAKVAYAKDLANHIVTGKINLKTLYRQSDDRIVEELVDVNGIGRWTAEMFLIFHLGRPDVWPIDDLGIRNAVAKHYRIEPKKPAMLELGEQWRPWRTVASWYLWRSLQVEPV